MKIYTKTGDDGSTGLLGNARVRKDSARIEAFGAVDEINAAAGVILAHLPAPASAARGWLESIQNDLFILGAMLATPPQSARRTSGEARHQAAARPFAGPPPRPPGNPPPPNPPKPFTAPKGRPCAAFAHLGRAVCRRAERRVVALDSHEKLSPLIPAYLNRLSDFFFVLARWVNRQEGGTETAWINPLGDPGAPQPDKLSASLGKLEHEKERRKSLFEKTSEELQKKKAEAERNFRQNVDQIRKEGGKVEKPVREIDLD